jgi:hypothetical protein
VRNRIEENRIETEKIVRDNALGKLARAIVDNTKGDLFWIGELLLSTLERETGYKWNGDRP